jgi:hypothetical protein
LETDDVGNYPRIFVYMNTLEKGHQESHTSVNITNSSLIGNSYLKICL